MLTQHTVASGAGQGEGPAAVGMVEHAHGYEVKRLRRYYGVANAALIDKLVNR